MTPEEKTTIIMPEEREIIALLEDLNARLKTVQLTKRQVWRITDIYRLLDLNIDDFSKIIDAIGVDKLIAKEGHYGRLARADMELKAKQGFADPIA